MKIGEFRAAVDSLNWNRRDLSGATRQEFVAMDVRTRLALPHQNCYSC